MSARQKINISLPKDILKRLDKIAEENYLTRTDVIVQAILQMWGDTPIMDRPRKRRRTPTNGAADGQHPA